MPISDIQDIARYAGQEATVRGWLRHKRVAGKIAFLVVRDGTGEIQAVVSKVALGDEAFELTSRLTQESSLVLTGTVQADARAPGGHELHINRLEVLHLVQEEFPIQPKEHGTGFLMEHRHLWIRSHRQQAILRIRHELIRACRNFFDDRGFFLVDTPIFTPNACEGTTTLFETDYFGQKAYLTQSGQLYNEATAAAFGKVYCFGPTFRAEKSKTRRHLMEFWMVEPEVAFLDFEGLQDLAEEFIESIVDRVLDRCKEELKTLERDTSKLENVTRPFPRITYRQAIELLASKGSSVKFGDDFGGDEETVIANSFDRPVMITRYPAAIKAFYMQPDPKDPTVALALDMIAPEGYGEIIGGSQRIHDHDLLLQRLRDNNLPIEAFQWYLDIRKYGTFPHSGFGIGVERVVAWISGVPHLRETIPYPRMLNRIYP